MKETIVVKSADILRDISFSIWWYLMRNKKFPDTELIEFYSLERILRFAETIGLITQSQSKELREMRDSEKMFSIQSKVPELEHITGRVRVILNQEANSLKDI